MATQSETPPGQGTFQAGKSVPPDDTTEWPQPETLGPTPPPAFPTDALPERVREYVHNVALRTQTPPDMAALLALSVISTALQGRAEVYVNNAWIDRVRIWTAVIANTGERKSPVIEAMAAPLYDWQDEVNILREADISRDKAKVFELEENLKTAQRTLRDAKKGKDFSPDALRAAQADMLKAQEELDQFRPTVPMRLTASDITPEQLSKLSYAQGERAAVLSAEGELFDLMTGRYTNGRANLEFYLKAWAGDRYESDRADRSEVQRHPALSVGVTIQPSVLETLTAKRTLIDKGLIARFLFAAPAPMVGRRDTTTQHPPNQTLKDLYFGVIQSIASDALAHEEPAHILITAEGNAFITEVETANEPRLRPGQDLGLIIDWGSKYISHLVRVAACIAAAEAQAVPKEIRLDHLRQAHRIVQYAEAHAMLAYGMTQATETERVTDAIIRLLKAWPESTITHTELATRSNYNRLGGDKTTLDEALKALTVGHYLRIETPHPKVWAINPALQKL